MELDHVTYRLWDVVASIDETILHLQADKHRLEYAIWLLEGDNSPVPAKATFQLDSTNGDNIMGITVDSVNEALILAFEDDHGDAVDAPEGVLVTFAIEDESIATVTTGAAEVDPGGSGTQVIPGPLTILTEGTTQANVSFTNADGMPVLGPDGVTPISPPAAVTITVNPGAPAGTRLAVSPD
jgi:hypothetical protein